MPQPVDVGATLGGRYKVTASVLASAENDLVLDGVDQVLNRAVSILLAAPENTAQVSASAREIATGERASNVQILDLGVSDGRTYLVTNKANAADLLDLVIERDAPFIEPFFTDTLGSEIFGMPRSREPETSEDEDRYADEPAGRAPRKPLISGRPLPKLPKFGRAGAGAGAALSNAEEAASARDLEFGGAAGAPAEAATGAATMPPPPSARPASGAAPATGQTPKVSRWTETDYDSGAPAEKETALPAAAAGHAPARDPERRPSNFPKSAVAANTAADEDFEDYDDDDESPGGRRTLGRVLVGAVLTLVLVAAVVMAVGTLGRLGGDPDQQAGAEPTASASAPAEAPPAEAPAQTAPAPVPIGVSRLVPSDPGLDAENDGALPQILDGNPATYWSSYVYATDTFGGLATNLALVVELEDESAINKIDISQLNGTGGSFSVLLNDAPTLDGAAPVAVSGFTGPTTSIQVPKVEGEAATAKYVIVNFTQLPRLSGGLQAAYPWGLRIAEIGVS